MGLDAMVYCDCVEKRRLRKPHPNPRLLRIAATGEPWIQSNDPLKWGKHDAWMEHAPCKHKEKILDDCRVGSAGGVDLARSLLEQVLKSTKLRCPVLMRKVLYMGYHTGDHLTLGQVAKLAREIPPLQELDMKQFGVASADRRYIRQMLRELLRVSRAALKVKKPIVF